MFGVDTQTDFFRNPVVCQCCKQPAETTIINYRPETPPITEEDLTKLRELCGDEIADIYDQGQHQMSRSYECPSCAVLSDDDFFLRMRMAEDR